MLAQMPAPDEELRELVTELVRVTLKDALKAVLRDALGASEGSAPVDQAVQTSATDAAPVSTRGSVYVEPPSKRMDGLFTGTGRDTDTWEGLVDTTLPWVYLEHNTDDPKGGSDNKLEELEVVFQTADGFGFVAAGDLVSEVLDKQSVLDMAYFRPGDRAAVEEVINTPAYKDRRVTMRMIRVALKRGNWDKYMGGLLEPSACSVGVDAVHGFVTHLPASQPFGVPPMSWVDELAAHGVPIVDGNVHGYRLRYNARELNSMWRYEGCIDGIYRNHDLVDDSKSYFAQYLEAARMGMTNPARRGTQMWHDESQWVPVAPAPSPTESALRSRWNEVSNWSFT